MKKTLRLAAILGLAVSCGTVAWAGTEKLSNELKPENRRGSRSAQNVEVIVQYKVTPTEEHHQKVVALGGRLNAKMDFIKSAHYTVPSSALAALAEDPDVAYVTPNRAIKPMFDMTTVQTVHSDIGMVYGYFGAGMAVAIIDSGIAPSTDFNNYVGGSTASRIVYQQSFVGGTPADQYGHGTHVAGLAAGYGLAGSGAGYYGSAIGANIVNLRVLDQNGAGTDANVIAAIDEAISLQSKYNIKVINLSLGRPVYEAASLDPLCQAVEAAWKAGITVVVAAGNDGRDNSQNTNGYGTITAPGNDPYVVTVGAIKAEGTIVRTDDRIASYSSKGPTLYDHYVKPDVVAPGNQIASDLPAGLTLSNEYPTNQVATGYFMLSGTSMATPTVAAEALVLLSQHPTATPDQLKAMIMLSSSKTFPASSVAIDPTTEISYTSYYDVFTVGAGEVDFNAAITAPLPPSLGVGSAKSPAVSYNSTTGKVTMQGIGAANVVWGASSNDASEASTVAIHGEP